MVIGKLTAACASCPRSSPRAPYIDWLWEQGRLWLPMIRVTGRRTVTATSAAGATRAETQTAALMLPTWQKSGRQAERSVTTARQPPMTLVADVSSVVPLTTQRAG
jgi:hypothetical protein